MNDETGKFEHRLRQQRLKEIPTAWRAEIIATAMSREAKVEGRKPETLWLSTLVSRLSTFFWPHPKAWAALATVWVFIFVLNFSMRDKSPVVAEKYSPPSPEVVAELRQQRLLFAELMGQTHGSAPDADRRENILPGPRSQRVEFMAA